MSQNPYNSPQAPQGPLPGGYPSQKVNGPATGLLVTAGVGMALQAVGLLLNLLGTGVNAAAVGAGGNNQDAMMNMFSGGFGMVQNLLGLGIGVVVLLGALKMKKLESYGFSLTAAILAMIPCLSPCCCIGLPVGIWALVVLMAPDVKAAFRS